MIKSRVALYQKINVTRSTIYVENFILVSETAQGWYYATLLSKQISKVSQSVENSVNFISTSWRGLEDIFRLGYTNPA